MTPKLSLLNLYANLPSPLIGIVQFAALTLSLVVLFLSGAVLLHLFGIRQERKLLWATHINLGIIASAIVCTIVSLAMNLFGFVGPYLELISLTLLLMISFLYSKMRKINLFSRLRSGLEFYTFGIILTSIIFCGWFYFYRIDGVSSDPNIIAFMLDKVRTDGLLTTNFNPINKTSINYPIGSIVQYLAIANPFLTSISVVQIFPSIVTTLALFTFLEVVINYCWQYSRNQKALIYTFGLLLRISIFSIEYSDIFVALEGASRRFQFGTVSLFYAILVITRIERMEMSKNYEINLRFAFLAFLSALPSIVNPSNLHVSMVMFLSLILYVLAFERQRYIQFILGSFIALATTILFLVQDALFAKLTGPSGMSCRWLFNQSTSACSQNSEHFRPYEIVQSIDSSSSLILTDYLPNYFHNPSMLIPFFNNEWTQWFWRNSLTTNLFFLALIIIFIAGVIAEIRNRCREPFVFLTVGTALLLFLLWLGGFVQTWIFLNTSSAPRYMIKSYTETTSANIFVPIAIMICCFSVGYSFKLLSTVMITVRLVLAATFVYVSTSDAQLKHHKILKRLGKVSFTSLKREFEVLSAISQILPSDTVFRGTSFRYRTPNETWDFAQELTTRLQLYLNFPTSYGWTHNWPAIPYTIESYNQEICNLNKNACSLFFAGGANTVIVHTGTTIICDKHANEFLEKMGECVKMINTIEKNNSVFSTWRKK